jgi:hypothetical protein
MRKRLEQKMQPLTIAFLAAACMRIIFVLPAFAESSPPQETTGRAIPQEAIDTRPFARRPATMLERATPSLAPQADDNSCAPLDEPQSRNAPPRRGSGPFGPHLLLDIE